MIFDNYCWNCGQRILPNEPFCTGCGCKTKYDSGDDDYVLKPPVHNIGFFDFDINFLPFFDMENDYKYEICTCGYLVDVDADFCDKCGCKRSQGKFSKLLNKQKPMFSLDNVLCECGTINHCDNVFCEECGKPLKQDSNVSFDNYSNFNLEFEDSLFCFCGEENEKLSKFCKKCGIPLINYANVGKLSILCTCSAVNDINAHYCIKCGEDLESENSKIICVCGHLNSNSRKICENCERPLNPLRTIKTRYVCSCGEILDWDTDFCSKCGKNIKRSIKMQNIIDDKVNSIKSLLR